jgi:AraC-like DNA-binding protein
MLASYPLVQTSDANEIEAAWIKNSCGNSVDMSGAAAVRELVANFAPFDDGNLTYCKYESPIAVSFDAADYTRLIYQLRESSAIVIDGESSEFGSSRAGCLIPAGRRWRSRYAGALENLAVRMPTATLQRKLSAYLGSNREVLELLQPSAADPHGAEALRQAIFRLTKAVDGAERKFLPNLIVSSLDDIGLRLFTCFSRDVLAAESTPAAPSAVQLGRVEQYLVAHYAEPLTLETLADISGVSARNVIWYFQMRYGFTPQQYLERVRLQMAHLQLRILSGYAVESVALHCGFPSVAAFERSYQQQFGAAPIARDPPPAPAAAWPGGEGDPE